MVGTVPLGTGISSASGSTQEVVVTDVYVQFLSLALCTRADFKSSVYTTLTTCPVTSLVISGSTSFEEITTTISTVTRTSTSTLCTKCVAPPSKPAVSSTSPGETAVSSLPSFITYSLSQSSLSLPSISTSSVAGSSGTGGLSAISSKPEVPNTAASPSKSLFFPSLVSLTVSATSGTSSTLEFPGYGIVPSPTSTPGSPREEIFSNATSSIIPVYTAALLGNAYGGGFVSTPSVYVTKLPYPNGPASGVPPGYGSESSTITIGNNITVISAAELQTTTAIGTPGSVATISPNVSVLLPSENEGSTPTFISLSPFGGEVVQESGPVPTVISVEVPSGSGSAIIGIQASIASFPTSTLVGGAANPSTVATVSSLSAGPSSFQAITTAENTGSSVIPITTVAGFTLSPTFSSSDVNIEATPAGSPTSGEIGVTIIPSLPAEQSAGPLVTLAVGPSAEQTPAVGQPAASTPTPIIVTNSTTALPVVGINGQIPAAGQSVAPTSTQIIVAGTTALAVIPSPVVGANGLTSLAVFSTPIAPAGGLTTPAVLLTPIVGANGLTSLAVVATPVVGANGLTSLAIGFETETTPAADQSNSAPTPIEGFVVVQPPAFTPQVSGSIPSQVNVAASGIANVVLPSGSAESPVSGDSGSGNYSIHVLLNPTTVTQFQGSAVRLSLGFGVGLFGLMVFLVML